MRQRVLGYREEQVYRVAISDLEQSGRVRSYDAIAQLLGMRHRSHVCDVMGRLERRGLIQRIGEPGRRSITAIQTGGPAR